MRAILLVSSALCLVALPAAAQDATWLANPGSGDFYDPTNWSGGSVPTGTATFGTSATTALTLGTMGSYGGWTFNAGASNYTFDITDQQTFTGAGIVINGGSATITADTLMKFLGGSTAGSATIVNNSSVAFRDSSTAGNATITTTNNIGFSDTSTAGNATITNSGVIFFTGNSSAGSATITSNRYLYFYDNSTAGSAIIDSRLVLYFVGAATAGNATITSSGVMLFFDTGTAGSATIANNGNMTFSDTSSAGSAIITNGSSANLTFNDSSTAGNATITNNGLMQFNAGTTAGSATITNNGNLYINSTAASATIINNNYMQFGGSIGAGSATITNNGTVTFYNFTSGGDATFNNSGTLNFDGGSTAGNAAITNTASGVVDFSATTGLAFRQISAGSIDGGGFFRLGVNELTVGGNNLSSNVTGVIADGGTSGGTGGSLVKIGTGTMTLSGTNAYTGGTTINAGAIAITTDRGLGAATGPLAFNGGTLQFNAAFNLAATRAIALNAGGGTIDTTGFSTSITQGINGTGGLTKTGVGTLTLSGTNAYTGATTVNGGTLAVNGSILASSGVNVNAGGTLAGTGTLGNTLVSGGTFAPGNGTAGSSMTVNGTLEFNAASTYLVSVNPTTASFTNVSGVATLGGATVNTSFAPGSYISKQYTILTAGSISGTFGTLANTNLPSNFHDSLSYDATHAYLNLDLTFTTPAANTLRGNQNNVANALINYFNTTGGIPLTFATLSAGSLSQASGQPGASTAQAGFAGTGQFINGVFDGAFGDGPGQGGTVGFAQDDDEANAYAANAYATKRKASREAKDAYAAVTPRTTPAFDARWNVWASVYGGNSRVNGDSTAGSNTTTSRIFGTVAGASYRFTPDTLAGFALGGAGSSFDIANGFGGGRADVFNAAVYAKHTMGAAYVAGLLGYSWQDTSTDRTVTISGTDKLHASFKAQALAARLEGGWRYATPMIGITPYAALQTTTFYLPAYGETATSGSNTFALNYASKTVTATRSELGAKFDKAMLVQGGTFTLKAKTAWAHDWNTDRSATATFQALPGATFMTDGAQPSANAALVSLGAEMKWHNGWSIAALIDGEFSRTTTGYAGKGSAKYAW
jgi:autotransporter-associated beta strand protein